MTKKGCPVRAFTPVARKIIAKTKATGREYYALRGNCSIHTHPLGVPRPSVDDIRESRRIGKPCLCVALVPQRTVICWNVRGGSSDSGYEEMCRWRV